jgi:hypothetical protein
MQLPTLLCSEVTEQYLETTTPQIELPEVPKDELEVNDGPVPKKQKPNTKDAEEKI